MAKIFFLNSWNILSIFQYKFLLFEIMKINYLLYLNQFISIEINLIYLKLHCFLLCYATTVIKQTNNTKLTYQCCIIIQVFDLSESYVIAMLLCIGSWDHPDPDIRLFDINTFN